MVSIKKLPEDSNHTMIISKEFEREKRRKKLEKKSKMQKDNQERNSHLRRKIYEKNDNNNSV